MTRIVWIVREHADAVTLAHTVQTERKHHDPLAIPGQGAGRDEEPAALDALPGHLAGEADAVATILGNPACCGPPSPGGDDPLPRTGRGGVEQRRRHREGCAGRGHVTGRPE